MTLSAADEAVTRPRNSARGVKARLSTLLSIVLAIVLSLTPITAIWVLGWLVRIMRRETAIALCRQGEDINSRKEAIEHLASLPEMAHLHSFPGWWTGLMDTFRSSLKAAFAIVFATLPFGALLLLAWWAGWENSFNKGYEQAWVGPLVALAGTALAVFVLMHLPMAFAHHAAEQRVGAIWELGRIRKLIAHVRWRYLLLTVGIVTASAPLFISQIIPTFIEGVFPELAGADEADVNAFAFQWHLSFSAYLVLALIVLRRWSSRLYARASFASGQLNGPLPVALNISKPEVAKRPSRLGGVIPMSLIAASWFGVIAALFVSQFANHAWWNWVNLPIIGLPWIFRPF